MAIQAGTLQYVISVDSSSVASGLSAAESKIKGFGNKMSTFAIAKGQILGRLIEKAGQATIAFVKGSVQESMNFDKSMSQVAATLGKSTKEVQDLAKFAREMGSKTAFTAQEAAEGLNYMALAGYSAETSMKMLPTVLNLAAAGNMKLADASDMVTDAQSALGLSIGETETMVDQMAKTASSTNTSVSQLGQAFLTIGGSAKRLKGGTKELSALLGVLANNGIKGAEGGTALRNVLNGLSNPAGKAAKGLKQLGVEAYDADGNLRSLPDILVEMNGALSDKTMKERTELFAKMFNVRDLKSIEALLSMTGEKWEELMGKIGDSDGAAGKMAETQLDNLTGDVTIFNSALTEAKLSIVEGLTPSLRKFTQMGTKFVQRLTNAFKKGGLKGAIKEVGTIFKDFVSNLKTSENPILNAIGRVMSIFADGISWDSVKETISGAWDTVVEGVKGLGKIIFGENVDGSIKWPTWADVEQGAIDAWNAISEGLGTIAQWVLGTPEMPSANDVGKAIHDWWDNNVKPIINGVLSFLFGTPTPEDSTGEQTKSTIQKWWDGIVVPLLKGVIDFTLGLFGLPSVDEMVAKIKAWWEDVKAKVGQLIMTATIKLFGQNPNQAFGKKEGQSWSQGVTDTYKQWNMPLADLSQVQNLDDEHAKGAWDIPYNGYVAKLHRDEMVLSASRARKYREGESDMNYEAVGEIVGLSIERAFKKVNVLMSGDKVGDLTTKRVRRNINAQSFSRVRAYGG